MNNQRPVPQPQQQQQQTPQPQPSPNLQSNQAAAAAAQHRAHLAQAHGQLQSQMQQTNRMVSQGNQMGQVAPPPMENGAVQAILGYSDEDLARTGLSVLQRYTKQAVAMETVSCR